MSRATFNRITHAVVEKARNDGLPPEHFTVHDLRRTGSTLLNELGFNRDWIEKCLAHEEGRSSRGVYNKAEYEVQRCHMLQEWADLIDAWVSAETPSPAIFGPPLRGGRDRARRRIAGLDPHRRRGRHLKLSRHLASRRTRRYATHHPNTKIIRNSSSHETSPLPQNHRSHQKRIPKIQTSRPTL